MDQSASRETFGRDALPEPPIECGPWTLSRLEIRTRLDGKAWPLARVEVDHVLRGRVTDIAVASGGAEAVFKALRQIVGLPAEIDKLTLDYRPTEFAGEESRSGPPTAFVEIVLALGDARFTGTGRSADVLTSSAIAYLMALSEAERSAQGRPIAAE